MNHLHLNVPDVAEARTFFETYFGFRHSFDHGSGVFLRDDTGFLLAIDPLAPGEAPPALPDWFHLGFCLPEPALVRALFQRMQAAGARFARELREFGDDAVNFYCWAPGGYKVEVSWNREE